MRRTVARLAHLPVGLVVHGCAHATAHAQRCVVCGLWMVVCSRMALWRMVRHLVETWTHLVVDLLGCLVVATSLVFCRCSLVSTPALCGGPQHVGVVPRDRDRLSGCSSSA